MRILHIIPYFYPAWAYGGTCRAAWELARALVRHGQQAVVLTTDALDAQQRVGPAFEVVEGVEIHRAANISNRLAWSRLFLPLGFRSHLYAEVKRADVVHLHEFRSYQNAVALPIIEQQRKPFVVTPQGSLPRIMGRYALKAVYDRLYGQRILRKAARLHALDDMESRQYIALGVAPARIAIRPNGIDPAEFQALPDPDAFRTRHGIAAQTPIVLFLARVNRIKGVDFLVQSFALVHKQMPQALLVIVGPDDGYLGEVQRQVHALGIADHVRFIGYLDGIEKLAAYRAASVYVLPSTYDIFGITLLEALACGTPVIATAGVGFADFMHQNNLGAVVKFGDTQALQTEIAAVLQRPLPELAARSAAGRQYVLENFAWDNIARNWLQVYADCAVN